MNPSVENPVDQVLGQLLRQPEQQRDVDLERALMRLQAARSDAAYLLLHRVLVLETALQQLHARTAAAAGATGKVLAVPAPGAALGQPASRSFLRDAAVVTAGIVAGQALWQGLSDASAADGGDGLDIEGWL